VPRLKFDDKGLLVAIAQDHLSGEVRMVAWMNREALDRTLQTGLATFYSRSRQKLWVKGESSGNHLRVHAVTADCDGDAVVLSVSAEGPSCHTGARNCFFNPVDRSTESAPDASAPPLVPIITQLERIIDERGESTSAKSYTKSLLEAGTERIGGKITEEAGELVDAIRSETSERVAAEAADLLFHLLVGLRSRGVAWDQVIEVLRSRMGVSGHVEKAGRAQPPVT
jgi:phosphoribosyl-AMP cyclohydrolase / phosphoribosyl-ATP pyrophosphohydrolase